MKKTVCPNGFWGGARGSGEGKKDEDYEGREKTKKRKENYTVFRFSFGQCTFAARKASSRLPPFFSGSHLSPFFSLSLSPSLSLSLPLSLSLSLSFSRFLTHSSQSLVYSWPGVLSLRYLRALSRARSTRHRDFFEKRAMLLHGEEKEEETWVPSLSASEELIQPPETSSFHDLPRSGKNNFPGFPPLSPWDSSLSGGRYSEK